MEPSQTAADIALTDSKALTCLRRCATMDLAITMATTAYRETLGKTIEIEDVVSVDAATGDAVDHRSDPGRPFVVQVIETGHDEIDRDMETHLDPIWDVEVVDGRGIIEANRYARHFVHAGSYELTSPRRPTHRRERR